MPPHPASSTQAPAAPPPPPQTGGGPEPVLHMIDVAVPALRQPRRIMLEAVNWQVNPGDFWVVGGLHGSGKSDFISVAAGILPPAHGAFRLFGRTLSPGFEHERVALQLRLGLVFDGGRLLNHLSVAENILLPIRYHRNLSFAACADRLDALLSLTGLQDWAGHHPGSLSASRLQRAGLARALALRPELLLLDSPLTGLDPHDAAWWLELLSELDAGHAIMDGQPLTLVVTADDLRPWRGRPRQLAVLRSRTLIDFSASLQQSPDVWFDALLSREPGT